MDKHETTEEMEMRDRTYGGPYGIVGLVLAVVLIILLLRLLGIV